MFFECFRGNYLKTVKDMQNGHAPLWGPSRQYYY